MTDKWKFLLSMTGAAGFAYGGWFTIQTSGIYAAQMLLFCAGMGVAFLCFLAAASIKSEHPHKRFKSHGVLL